MQNIIIYIKLLKSYDYLRNNSKRLQNVLSNYSQQFF